MRDSIRSALFGGAIFMAGISAAHAQEFVWYETGYDPVTGFEILIEGPDTIDGYDSYTRIITTYGSDSGYDLIWNESYGGFSCYAYSGDTRIESTANAATDPGPAFAQTEVFALFTVGELTTVELTWDFANATPTGGTLHSRLLLRELDLVTDTTVRSLVDETDIATAGQALARLQPGFYYEARLLARANGNNGDASASLTITDTCFADCDLNGAVNVDDVDCFVADYLAGSSLVDCDNNGTINIDDLDCFVASFLGGCP